MLFPNRKGRCSSGFYSTGLGCICTVFHVGSYYCVRSLNITVWSIRKL